MSGTFRCILCKKEVERTRLEEHVAEAHSSPELKERELDGVIANINDAEYVAESIGQAVPGGGEYERPETVAPVSSALDELGIKFADLAAPKLTIQTGGALTNTEAKGVFAALEELIGYKADRAAFLVNFLAWGFENSFSEELSEAGGFDVPSHATVARKVTFVKMATLHQAVLDHFAQAQTGRSFTFRRFGRFLGPKIPSIVDRNPDLAAYYNRGTNISNHLGIPPKLFLTATSVFDAIKPYGKWSKEERQCWAAHNRAVRKFAGSATNDFLPQDLRPSPSEAETMVLNGESDFTRRHSSNSTAAQLESLYPKGADMLAKAARGNVGRSGLGL